MSSALLRQDFVPMVSGYLIIMAALALGLRLARRSPVRPASGESGRPAGAAEAGRPADARVSAAGWWRLARQVAGTMIGGYLLLMAVVILYYYLVARVGGAFIKSAFTGGALLIGLVTPGLRGRVLADGAPPPAPGRHPASRPSRARLTALPDFRDQRLAAPPGLS